MVSYKQNRTVLVKKYNEYLFTIIFFNCLSWMLYGIVTKDLLIYLSCISSLFFDFGFIQVLYRHAEPNIILHLEILSGVFMLYFIIIIYLLNFTQLNFDKIMLPIIGTVSTNFAPLAIINQVIKTKSNELIYLPQALIGTLNLSCWLVYGLLLNDIYQIITNSLGLTMCVCQLAVYFLYWEKNTPESTSKVAPDNLTQLV